MSQHASPGTVCAAHPEVAATWVCGRCATFMCQACERRTRPEALPICPNCAQLRAQQVAPVQVGSKTALQTAGFVLGFVSILPIPVLMIGSLITNIVALVRAKEPPASLTKWKSIVGLSVTVLSMLGWGGVALIAMLLSASSER